MTEPAHLAYAHDVLEGREISGKYMKLAAERSLSDHAHPPAPWRYYPEAAAPRVKWAQAMPLTQGARWTGTLLVLRPWQLWNTCEVWGWRHEDDPYRMRFRQSVLEVAKGAGKTPYCAQEALYTMLYGDPGSNVVSFATREKQAQLVFNAAKRMIQSRRFPPGFRHEFEITKSLITAARTGTEFEALPSTDRNLDGYVIAYLIFDEAASLLHRDRTMDILSAARKLPSAHTRWITTAQPGARGRLYYERRQHCIDVLEGRETDERIHAALYVPDAEDEKGTAWLNPKVWPKANPNLDVTQDRDMLKEALDEALHSPSTRAANLAKHLNIYTSSITAWIDTAEWSACKQDTGLGAPIIGTHPDPADWLDALAAAGIEGKLSSGVDLAEVRDLTGVTCALGGNDGRTYLHFKAFAPRAAVERLPIDVRGIWERAIADDVLIVNDGRTTDYDAVEDYLRSIYHAAGSSFASVATDPRNATDLVANLERDEIPIMAVGQTTTILNAPTKHAERLIANRRVRHDGNPFIEWQVGNCKLYTAPANNNVRIVKPDRMSVYKVDSIAAMINAIAALGEDSQPETGFVFRAAHF